MPLKVRLLAQHVLNMNKFELVINHSQEIPNEKIAEFKNGLEKIKNNTPIQYITNHQEFMKLDFYVDENVLIPQPDTEILVEQVIEYSKKLQSQTSCLNCYVKSQLSNSNSEADCANNRHLELNKNLKILDLCTGSGAIAISLAKYIENAEIVASDISSKAIQIAKLNAEKNLVNNKITFVESDMFENLHKMQFDIIVSNPPYIETDTIKCLSEEVQKEPRIALDGGVDGLVFYKNIINHAYNYLNVDGALFLEIGFNQKDALFDLIQKSEHFTDAKCIQDLNGNDRVFKLGTEKISNF